MMGTFSLEEGAHQRDIRQSALPAHLRAPVSHIPVVHSGCPPQKESAVPALPREYSCSLESPETQPMQTSGCPRDKSSAFLINQGTSTFTEELAGEAACVCRGRVFFLFLSNLSLTPTKVKRTIFGLCR